MAGNACGRNAGHLLHIAHSDRPALEWGMDMDWLVAPALALGFVLVASISEPTVNYEIVPGGICAEDYDTCDAAVRAIRDGWLWPNLRGVHVLCVPHPNCFSARENCIPGYNGPRAEGYCD